MTIVGEIWEEQYDKLEAKYNKAKLKAECWKIVKNKEVDVYFLRVCITDSIMPLDDYNFEMHRRYGWQEKYELTQEEFNKLKKGLKNEI